MKLDHALSQRELTLGKKEVTVGAFRAAAQLQDNCNEEGAREKNPLPELDPGKSRIKEIAPLRRTAAALNGAEPWGREKVDERTGDRQN